MSHCLWARSWLIQCVRVCVCMQKNVGFVFVIVINVLSVTLTAIIIQGINDPTMIWQLNI